MGTIDDWNYARLRADMSGKFDRLPYEVNDATQKRLALFFRRAWKAIRRVFKKVGQILGGLAERSPDSQNTNARKTPYDYIHVRGLK